ncbi:TPM domain-containing protein [Thiocystis violacea]|uniref:TPM domain-containing protein n=1 Tax=Thiocystis violacea TaxID=13725 RepID=UPI001907BBD8|nr:TPM domain-containing protein [Thiocystis violacea]
MTFNRDTETIRRLRFFLAACLLAVGLFNFSFMLNVSPVVKIQLLMDEASVLTETESAFLVDYHNALLDDYGIDYRVITTTEGADLDALALERFDSLEAGTFYDSGRGLLLVVNPRSRQVRLEVGEDLSEVYTETFVEHIENGQMAPFFSDQHVGEGIVATSELIVTRAQEATKDMAFDASKTPEPTPSAPGISQATTAPAPDILTPMPDVSSQGSPIKTIDAYIQAMEEGNARPDLDIYTKASQEMLKDWVVTKTQMRNVAREHRRCTAERYQIHGRNAVVQYDPEPRVCNPYFLRREEGRWRIDFVKMQKYIRFDENNHWSIPWGAGEFSFAFPETPPNASQEDRCRWCFTFRSEDLVVLSIDPGSIGEKMGLKVGDKILELDGEKQPSMQWVFSHLYTVDSGELVTITVQRGEQRLALSHPAP